MSFILIHNSAIPLCLTKVTDEFTGFENINNFIIWTRFNIHWKVNAFWRGDYTSLWKIVFTQVGADCDCYGLVSCFFKDFKAFLAAPLLLFKLNWPKRHLYGLSHSESLLQIVRIAVFRSFSLLRFFSLGRYLNKVTSPDCDEDCWERFSWDSHSDTL